MTYAGSVGVTRLRIVVEDGSAALRGFGWGLIRVRRRWRRLRRSFSATNNVTPSSTPAAGWSPRDSGPPLGVDEPPARRLVDATQQIPERRVSIDAQRRATRQKHPTPGTGRARA